MRMPRMLYCKPGYVQKDIYYSKKEGLCEEALSRGGVN